MEELYIVSEYCPHCESEIEMTWSVEQNGYRTFCPVCGNELMLCDACMHDENGECVNRCDYDSLTGTCKYKTRFNAAQFAHAKERLKISSVENVAAIIKAFDRGIGDIDDVIDDYENTV